MSGKNAEEIFELQDDRDTLVERLDQMEEKLEAAEKQIKRCNLKFFGIEEMTRGTEMTNEAMIVDILNSHSSCQRVWQTSDIEHAYRIGIPRPDNSPRPLLVQFCHGQDKIFILKDQELRDGLRQNNIRVTSDLTTRQKNIMDFHRSQGKVAYFFKGRLHVKERPPAQSWYSSSGYYPNNHQDSLDSQYALQDEEWPQLHRRGFSRSSRTIRQGDRNEPSESGRRQIETGVHNGTLRHTRNTSNDPRARESPGHLQQEKGPFHTRKNIGSGVLNRPGVGAVPPAAEGGRGRAGREDVSSYRRSYSRDRSVTDNPGHQSKPVVPGVWSYSQAFKRTRPPGISTDRHHRPFVKSQVSPRRPMQPHRRYSQNSTSASYKQTKDITVEADDDRDTHNDHNGLSLTEDEDRDNRQDCCSDSSHERNLSTDQLFHDIVVRDFQMNDKNKTGVVEAGQTVVDKEYLEITREAVQDDSVLDDVNVDVEPGNRGDDLEDRQGQTGKTGHEKGGEKGSCEVTGGKPGGNRTIDASTEKEQETLDAEQTDLQTDKGTNLTQPVSTDTDKVAPLKSQTLGKGKRSQCPSVKPCPQKKTGRTRAASQSSIIDSIQRMSSSERSQGANDRGRTRSRAQRCSPPQ